MSFVEFIGWSCIAFFVGCGAVVVGSVILSFTADHAEICKAYAIYLRKKRK